MYIENDSPFVQILVDIIKKLFASEIGKIVEIFYTPWYVFELKCNQNVIELLVNHLKF